MNEIDLKARVPDREILISKIKQFATYSKTIIRDDEYWCAKDSSDSPKKIRIRKENIDGKISYLLTYKRKENKTNNGITIEVNEELESPLENPTPLIQFFTDSDYYISLKKHKEVMDFTYKIPEQIIPDQQLECTLELCNVPPLGNFLELEILSPVNDQDTVVKIQHQLQEILFKCGLSKDDIETKYYSQLFKELNIKESQNV